MRRDQSDGFDEEIYIMPFGIVWCLFGFCVKGRSGYGDATVYMLIPIELYWLCL